MDAESIAEIRKNWCLFLAPPGIGRAVDRAVLELQERGFDVEVWRFFAYAAPLRSRALSAPIDLLAISTGSPGAQTLSADSRLGALNPILEQLYHEQIINIRRFLKTVQRVGDRRE